MRLHLIVVCVLWSVLVSSLPAAAPALAPEPPVQAVEKLPPPPSAEVLNRIAAPAAKPVQKTKQGFTIEIDRSQQVLSVSLPKKVIWVAPEPEAQQTVEVIEDGAPLKQTSTTLARLKKGRVLYTTREDLLWVEVQIIENGKTVRGWVQKKSVKPVGEDNPPQKTLTQFGGENFASAALLIQKAKQFDDGLYAAVELALQNGVGPTIGKKEWLPRLAAAVDREAGGTPLAVLAAAAELGGNSVQTSPSVSKLKDAELAAFHADEKRSKPLGFYSWSKELESIFRQDRMLQTSSDLKRQLPGILAVGKVLAGDAETRRSYEKTLRLNEQLTNRFVEPSYRQILADLDGGRTPQLTSVSFLPPSRSHETDLILKLYGNRPVPADFELMTEVITRLKDGRLSFQPRADSGWYDHQLWSLEPLVRFDKSPEARQLQANGEYRKHLEDLFKGTYALLRETHVKQLPPPPAAEAAAPPPPVVEREKIYIQPDPHVELLPTMYARRAASYRFVRSVLVETFGAEHVAKLHRWTARGPVEPNLLDELDQMAGLFGGAYITACRDIGLAEEPAGGIGNGQPADEQAKSYLRWVASLTSDADLAPDARMMVPVFYDVQRKKTKVWVMLGWEDASNSIDYVKHPAVKITGPDGKPPAEGTGPEVIFYGSYRQLATPVFAEVYVTRILNRAEFRRHCDVYQSKAAILANLE